MKQISLWIRYHKFVSLVLQCYLSLFCITKSNKVQRKDKKIWHELVIEEGELFLCFEVNNWHSTLISSLAPHPYTMPKHGFHDWNSLSLMFIFNYICNWLWTLIVVTYMTTWLIFIFQNVTIVIIKTILNCFR
jgi:hypothetical protein